MDLQALVKPLLGLVGRASGVIRAHYQGDAPVETTTKADRSPLTQADLDSHRLLLAGLEEMTPAIPVLSEESAERIMARRRAWTRFWLVDPLDGTREFLDRNGEFTVNVALIERHRPVLGVVMAPQQDCAWVGIPGIESSRYTCDDGGSWRGEPTQTRPVDPGAAVELLVSRRPMSGELEACVKRVAAACEEVALVRAGSALKFCLLADGRGDLYPRFSPCSEWDVAAGHAVLAAAGGAVLGLDGRAPAYNAGDSLLCAPFYAVADPEHGLWRDLAITRHRQRT